MSVKFLLLGFRVWGGGKCRFYFYGRADFSDRLLSPRLDSPEPWKPFVEVPSNSAFEGLISHSLYEDPQVRESSGQPRDWKSSWRDFSEVRGGSGGSFRKGAQTS